jgi:hypothetical protein
MLSRQGLNVKLNSGGSLTVPPGGFDALLTRAGNLNVSLTTSGAAAVKKLLAAQGDAASPQEAGPPSKAQMTSRWSTGRRSPGASSACSRASPPTQPTFRN